MVDASGKVVGTIPSAHTQQVFAKGTQVAFYSEKLLDAPAFHLGSVAVYGGPAREVLEQWQQWDFVLCCGQECNLPEPIMTASAACERAGIDLHSEPRWPWVSIAWHDGAAAPLRVEHWQKLQAAIEGLAHPNEGREARVAVYCFGGHGRTGSALAILAGLAGLIPAGECPVEWIRARHSEDAVETEAQCKYIARILDRPVWAEGSYEMMFSHYRGVGQGDMLSMRYQDTWRKAQGAQVYDAASGIYRDWPATDRQREIADAMAEQERLQAETAPEDEIDTTVWVSDPNDCNQVLRLNAAGDVIERRSKPLSAAVEDAPFDVAGDQPATRAERSFTKLVDKIAGIIGGKDDGNE